MVFGVVICYRDALFLKDYKIAIRSIRGVRGFAVGVRSHGKALHTSKITLHLLIPKHDFVLGH